MNYKQPDRQQEIDYVFEILRLDTEDRRNAFAQSRYCQWTEDAPPIEIVLVEPTDSTNSPACNANGDGDAELE